MSTFGTDEHLQATPSLSARGREAVRARSPAFQPHIKRDLAVRWLREQELAAERRERGTFWIAVAILVLTVVGIALTLAGY
jgi:hypothetical protein